MTIADMRDYADSLREDWEYEHHGQACPIDTERWLADAQATKADANEMLHELRVSARANRWA